MLAAHEIESKVLANFPQHLLDLIAHDKREFDRPPLWRGASLQTSVLFTDFDTLWQKISSVYQTEVGALSYGEIPNKDVIAKSAKELLELILKII